MSRMRRVSDSQDGHTLYYSWGTRTSVSTLWTVMMIYLCCTGSLSLYTLNLPINIVINIWIFMRSFSKHGGMTTCCFVHSKWLLFRETVSMLDTIQHICTKATQQGNEIKISSVCSSRYWWSDRPDVVLVGRVSSSYPWDQSSSGWEHCAKPTTRWI